jgi:membrane-associated phospholipid phosphatase
MAVFYLTFLPVYFLAPAAAIFATHIPALPFERHLPLLPWMVIPYLSIVPAFLLPLWLMTPAQMRGLLWQTAACSLIAGIFFVVLPTRAGYPDVAPEGWGSSLLTLLRTVDVKGNLFPSLHVAFGTLIALSCLHNQKTRGRILIAVWLVLMIMSTLFTHQHHIADVVAGVLLGGGVWRFVGAPAEP